ncbi:MAG: M23 family metallopeptidase [Candidatus Obscuribacterales bacterium]|nr:M23 family metallopeptidase [Candidatus Obscuribacterales bacterium]
MSSENYHPRTPDVIIDVPPMTTVMDTARNAFQAEAFGPPGISKDISRNMSRDLNMDRSAIEHDRLDRIVYFQDRAGIGFKIGYDGDTRNVALFAGKDPNGKDYIYERQKVNGQLTDQWRCGDIVCNGRLRVSEDEMSFDGPNRRTVIRMDGTRLDEMRNGASLERNSRGQILHMRDGAGRDFSFSYDRKGQVTALKNESGSWIKRNGDTWQETNSGSIWHGQVQVDGKGNYSFTDKNQTRTTYTLDGRKKIEHNVDPLQNDVVKSIPIPDIKGKIQFAVKDGATTSGALHVDGAKLEIVDSKFGKQARIKSQDGDAQVRSFAEGLVAYSYRHDLSQEQNERANAIFALSPQDRKAIDNLQRLNPDQDLLVMQCWDKKAGGVRYQVYSGLDEVTLQAGQRIQSGTRIGKASDDGFYFAARRQRVSGSNIPLSL